MGEARPGIRCKGGITRAAGAAQGVSWMPVPPAPDGNANRSVVPIELSEVGAWLYGQTQGAAALLRLTPVARYAAGPVREQGT